MKTMLYATMIICTLAVTGAALYDHFKPKEVIENKISISKEVDKEIISEEPITKYHKDVRQFVIDTYEIFQDRGMRCVSYDQAFKELININKKAEYWFWESSSTWKLKRPMQIYLNREEVSLLEPMVLKIREYQKSKDAELINQIKIKENNLKLK